MTTGMGSGELNCNHQKEGSLVELVGKLKSTDCAAESDSIVVSGLSENHLNYSELAKLVIFLLNHKKVSSAKLALARLPGDTAETHALQAQVYYQEQNYSFAIARWQTAFELKYRASVWERFWLIDSYEKVSDGTSALQDAECIDLASLQTDGQRRWLAAFFFRHGKYNRARDLLLTFKETLSLESKLFLLNIYLQSSDNSEATWLLASIEREPLTRQQQELVSRLKINVMWREENYLSLASYCQQLIVKDPDFFIAYRFRLNALHKLSEHKALIDFYSVTYAKFPDQREDLVEHYSRELELDGQLEKAISILETACAQNDKLLPILYRCYLRNGATEKFIGESMVNQLDNHNRILILTDNIIVAIRTGAYKKLIDLVSALNCITVGNIKEHSAYTVCLNQLAQLHYILTSDVVDASKVIEKKTRITLLELLSALLPADIDSGENIVDTSRWLNLIDSKFVLKSTNLGEVVSSVESYFSRLKKCNVVMLNTYEQPKEARELAKYIRKKIENKTPTSLIRLGDGEGNVLDYPDYIESEQMADQAIIQNIWWGSNVFNDVDAEAKSSLMCRFNNSIKQADILGVPPVRRLLVSFDTLIDEPGQLARWGRGVIGAIGAIGLTDKSTTVITSCHVHTDLELWNCYFDLLNGLPEVHLISCHSGLDSYVKTRFGVPQVTLHRLPAESRYKRLFNHTDNETHYPDIYNKLMKKLPEISKGKVFLVGAGFFGKIYCDHIKQHGGIAIDVGSVMDNWAGYNTRESNELVEPCRGLHYNDREPQCSQAL